MDWIVSKLEDIRITQIDVHANCNAIMQRVIPEKCFLA